MAKHWKREVREKYAGEDFEEKWNKAFNLIRRYYGDVKGFSRSRATAEYLLGWKSLPEELEGDALNSSFSGTKSERFINETIERLSPLFEKYAGTETGEELGEQISAFESGEITYEDLKQYIKNWKSTSADYLSQKAGSN